MSQTGVDVFDTTLQETNGWLKELAEMVGLSDRNEAQGDLRATLHALRDRLTVDEVALVTTGCRTILLAIAWWIGPLVRRRSTQS